MSDDWRVVTETGVETLTVAEVDAYKRTHYEGETPPDDRIVVLVICTTHYWLAREVVAPGAKTASERVEAMREACADALTPWLFTRPDQSLARCRSAIHDLVLKESR